QHHAQRLTLDRCHRETEQEASAVGSWTILFDHCADHRYRCAEQQTGLSGFEPTIGGSHVDDVQTAVEAQVIQLVAVGAPGALDAAAARDLPSLTACRYGRHIDLVL